MAVLNYSTTVSIAATTPVVTLAEVKQQLSIAASDVSHDGHLIRLVDLATECVEHDARRALFTQTLVQTMDSFPCDSVIEIQRGPLVSVSSITYLDAAGTSQTWASSNYEVDTARGAVWLAYSATYPTIRYTQNAVTITYVAGQATVEQMAKHAVLLLVTNAFENREPIIIGVTSKNLEQSYNALIGRLHPGSYP